MADIVSSGGLPRVKDFTVVASGTTRITYNGTSTLNTVVYPHGLGYVPTFFVYYQGAWGISEQLPVTKFTADIYTGIYNVEYHISAQADDTFLYISEQDNVVPPAGLSVPFYFFLCSNPLQIPPYIT